MQQDLTKEEIPQEVIDELTEHYGAVSFDLDGDINDKTTSLKSKFCITETEMTTCKICDAETFKPVLAEGYTGLSFLVRVNKTDDGVCLKKVIQMKIFNTVNILGPVKPNS